MKLCQFCGKWHMQVGDGRCLDCGRPFGAPGTVQPSAGSQVYSCGSDQPDSTSPSGLRTVVHDSDSRIH